MSSGQVNTLVIKTAEGITFSMRLAGPVTRFFAWLIDLACISVSTVALSIVSAMLGFISADFAAAAVTIMYFLISIGYGIATEWLWRGQTIGKRLLKLRVVDEQGMKLQFSQVVIRNLLRFVDSLPLLYMAGGISCLVSKRAQRLGDYAANTVVIRSNLTPEYSLDDVDAGKYNSFRDYPYLEARLRQNVSPKEATLAMRALLRRNELAPLARVDVFRAMAAHFREKARFPEEATFGLTDEKYVSNVVDSIFKNSGDKT